MKGSDIFVRIHAKCGSVDILRTPSILLVFSLSCSLLTLLSVFSRLFSLSFFLCPFFRLRIWLLHFSPCCPSNTLRNRMLIEKMSGNLQIMFIFVVIIRLWICVTYNIYVVLLRLSFLCLSLYLLMTSIIKRKEKLNRMFLMWNESCVIMMKTIYCSNRYLLKSYYNKSGIHIYFSFTLQPTKFKQMNII